MKRSLKIQHVSDRLRTTNVFDLARERGVGYKTLTDAALLYISRIDVADVARRLRLKTCYSCHEHAVRTAALLMLDGKILCGKQTTLSAIQLIVDIIVEA